MPLPALLSPSVASQDHRMVLAGKDLKDLLAPTPLPQEKLSKTL